MSVEGNGFRVVGLRMGVWSARWFMTSTRLISRPRSSGRLLRLSKLRRMRWACVSNGRQGNPTF